MYDCSIILNMTDNFGMMTSNTDSVSGGIVSAKAGVRRCNMKGRTKWLKTVLTDMHNASWQ